MYGNGYCLEVTIKYYVGGSTKKKKNYKELNVEFVTNWKTFFFL